MNFMVYIDDNGRILLPKKIRKHMGVKPRDKIIIRVRENNIVELIPYKRLYRDVSKTFGEKFREWREEDHDASKLLFKMVK